MLNLCRCFSSRYVLSALAITMIAGGTKFSNAACDVGCFSHHTWCVQHLGGYTNEYYSANTAWVENVEVPQGGDPILNDYIEGDYYEGCIRDCTQPSTTTGATNGGWIDSFSGVYKTRCSGNES